MSTLVNQMITVALLSLSSILTASQVGCEKWLIGLEKEIERCDADDNEDHRSLAYLRIQVRPADEEILVARLVFPQRSNRD